MFRIALLAGSRPLAFEMPDNGVAIPPPPPPTNYPPLVRITNPPNGALFRSPVNIPLYAYAHDRDGSVANVEFFGGTNDLGTGQGVCLQAWPGSSGPPAS